MTKDQLLLLLLLAASVRVTRVWRPCSLCRRARRDDRPPFPGGTPAPARAVAIASLGALFILAAETGGEHVLALSAQQSKMTALFAVNGLAVDISAKAWFTTTAIAAKSLWLYTVRFLGLNRQRSLLPCFVAPATKNLGVFGIKYAQGFVGGWW